MSPENSAPIPRPPVVIRLVITAPRRLRPSGASSTIAAPKVLDAAPVAMPCRTRPKISQPIDGANRNTTTDASSTANAPMSSGRLPMKSESDPATSSVRMSPKA